MLEVRNDMRDPPQPLTIETPLEVPLSRTPLVRVIAQVRFPPILAIRSPDRVATFQEALRATYPNLKNEQVRNIDLNEATPQISDASFVWRLADRRQPPVWRVSLGVNFLALETSSYDSRDDFLERFRAVVVSLKESFNPVDATRIGLRYVDHLKGEAVARIGDLIQPKVLGILQPNADMATTTIGNSTIHAMTDAQFHTVEGRIQGRWGMLPANATYDPSVLEPVDAPSWFLDLDMFVSSTQPFEPERLLNTSQRFAEGIYFVFRQMVTDEFLKFYGGQL